MPTAAKGRLSPRGRTREDVYELIRSGQAGTRTELTDVTGLPRSTVNHAVGKLIAEGRIAESEVEEKGPGSGSGRPGIRLTPVAAGGAVAAIDFGHNHIHVALANSLGQVIVDERVAFEVDRHAVDAIDAATGIVGRLQEQGGVPAVAIVAAGIPGPVDKKLGRVQSPTILSSWVGMAPANELEDRLGVPAVVANDAVLGAYGELCAGAGRHFDDFIYVKASHGVGAALVLDGRLYTGATGIAGEIGHFRLDGRAELCRCGNRGCLEAVVSMGALEEQLLHTHPDTDLGTFDLDTLTDPVTLRLLNESGRMLGTAIANLCNLINPSAVIIGGELASNGGPFVEGVTSSVRRYAQAATSAALEVMAAELGVRAELTGAIQMAASRAYL